MSTAARLACVATLLCCTAAGPATRPAATQPAPPKRVVLLLDVSGSMMNSIDEAKMEARKGIDMLAADQSFGLFAITDQGPRAAMEGMRRASPENKKAAYEFLDRQAPRNVGDPVPALREQLKGNPDAIWFYTDGDVGDWNAVFAEVRRWRRRVPIHTTLRWAAEKVHEPLILLARETGGVCTDTDGTPVDRPVTFRPGPVKPTPPKAPARR